MHTLTGNDAATLTLNDGQHQDNLERIIPALETLQQDGPADDPR